jgi:hypothetical protein
MTGTSATLPESADEPIDSGRPSPFVSCAVVLAMVLFGTAAGILVGGALARTTAPDQVPAPAVTVSVPAAPIPGPTVTVTRTADARASRSRPTTVRTPAKSSTRKPARSGPAGVRHLNWTALAKCESGGRVHAVGGGGLYFGLYQFDVSTWRGHGGHGHPRNASAAEQLRVAKNLYADRGRQPWPTCGKHL